jgi:spore germination protein YaaH
MIRKLLFGFGIAVVMGMAGWYFAPNQVEKDLLNPLGWQRWVEKNSHKVEVVGFLPTWMIGKTRVYGKEIDQLIFSGIEVTKGGELVWDVQSKKVRGETYKDLKTEIKKQGGKNVVSIKLFEDDDLEAFIGSSEARRELITQVAELVKSEGFDGVNIDFEYMSNAVRILDDDFVGFMKEARNGGWGEVGVDVFANTIIKGNTEKIGNLIQAVDWVVIMAYDFHRPGSDYAGSVAPMEAEVGARSIKEITDKLLAVGSDLKKVVMAYPLYGYEWVTINDDFGSAQVSGGYGRTVFYSEGVGITGTKWDEKGKSPWATWQEPVRKSKKVRVKVGKKWVTKTEYYVVNEWHSAYFENENSLKIKIDEAKKTKVGGVGYWALGYEGKNSNLMMTLGDFAKSE